MKGDFSRQTFRAGRHYWGVLRQQGRVDLDADWNEQVHINRHEHRIRTTDLLGACGGPFANAGFAITAEDGNLRIGAGRYYVAGVRCDNEEATFFDEQPDPPGEAPPDTDGVHLAYLDVWDRHVTALDDPLLRETALGGPDTATRARTVWQVRTQPLEDVPEELQQAVQVYFEAAGEDDASEETVQAAFERLHALIAHTYCHHPVEPAGGALDPNVGLLAARASSRAATSDDPCRFEPEDGYRRLENRLYRVEIHRPGGAREATFKWSRDNGSVVVPIENYDLDLDAGETETDRIVVRRLGFDALTSLSQGQYIEIIADDDELAGRPGALVQITHPPDANRRILQLSHSVEAKDLSLHPKVRRWDMHPEDGTDSADGRPVIANRWLELEDGIEIRFRDGQFHTSDYWLVPARTPTASVEWPPYPTYPGESVDADPEDLPPLGIAHRRAPLAAIIHDGSAVVTTVDLRRLFPAATALHTLNYAGGDGQEPDLRDGLLPRPLQASVVNGDQPVAGALVRFEVVDGGGELVRDTVFDTPQDTVTVPTNADGMASVRWRVDRDPPHHRVQATLLDACGDPTGTPVFFNARVTYQLHYLSGDGQEGTPEDDLTLRPLRVWGSHGRWPLPGATVDFRVSQGSGTIHADGQTGPDGVAECTWTLDPDTPHQQVTARLLDTQGDAVHEAAIVFNARLRRAREVAYEPAEHCVTLQHATTVQEALDTLCAPEPGIHVTGIRFDTGEPLVNDALFPVALLGQGVAVECDAEVDPGALRALGTNESKPVCHVTLHLPFPFDEADQAVWGEAVVGTRPLRLDGQLHVDGQEIFWFPTEAVQRWLDRLFVRMGEFDRGDRVLAYLTLAGDFIWNRREDERLPLRYLDGEVSGQLREDGGTDAILPSGDGRRGGDLAVWFWLVAGGTPQLSVQPSELDFGGVVVGSSEVRTLRVFNEGDAPLSVQAAVRPDDVFAVSSAERMRVEPGGSADVRVRFRPDRAGTFSATLALSSNDPQRASVAVPLTGVAEEVAEPGFVQFVHNAVDTGPIDVTFNEQIVEEQLAYRAATTYGPVEPGDLEVRLDNIDGQPLFQDVVLVEPGRASILIACRDGADDASVRLVVAEARRVAESEEMVELFVASGLLDANGAPTTVDVHVVDPVVDDSVLAEGLATCEEVTDYRSLPPERLQVVVETEDGQGQFQLDLRDRGGQSLVLLVSGRVDADDPIALVAFDADGEPVEVA